MADAALLDNTVKEAELGAFVLTEEASSAEGETRSGILDVDIDPLLPFAWCSHRE